MNQHEKQMGQMFAHFAEALRSLASALDILATAEDGETLKSEADWKDEAAKTKGKPGRKPKAEAVAAKEEPKAISPDDFDAPEAEAAQTLAVKTADDLKKLLVDFATKHGKDKAFAILGKFKAKKVADLPADKIGEVYSAVEAGL